MLSDSPIPPPPPLEGDDVPTLEVPPSSTINVDELLHQHSHHQQYVLGGTVNRALVLWAQRSVDAMNLMRRQQAEYRSLKEQHTATSTSNNKASSPSVDDGLARAMRDARPTGTCPTPSDLLDTLCTAANIQEEVIGASRRSLCTTLQQQQHISSIIPCEVLLRSNHQYIFTLLPSSILEGSATYLDALLEEYNIEISQQQQQQPSSQVGGGGGVSSIKSTNTTIPTSYEEGFCAIGDRLRRGLEVCLRGATKSTDPTTGASLDHKRPASRHHGRVGSGPPQRRGKASVAVVDDDEEGPMSSSSLPLPPSASSSKLRALQPHTSYNFASAMALACNPSLGIGTGPRPPTLSGVSTVPPPQMDAEVAAEILVLHTMSCKQRLAAHNDQGEQSGHEGVLEVLAHLNRSYGNIRSVSASGLPPSIRAFYYAELQGIATPCTKVPDMRAMSPAELPPPDALLQGLRIGAPTIVRANSAASSDTAAPSPSVTTRMGSGWLGVVPTRIHQRTVPDERSCGSSGSVSGALRRMVIAAVLHFVGHDDRYFVVMDEVLLLVCGLWEDEGVQSKLRRSNTLAVLPTGPLEGPGSQTTTTEALSRAATSLGSSTGGAAPPMLFSSTCGQLAAPIAFLTTDVSGGYMLLRSQYVQLWMPLQQPSLELLVTLSAAETFIVTAATRNTQITRDAGAKVPHGLFDLRALMRCFQVLKLAPLSLMADWIGGGFVGILRPQQVLELWDRVLSLHNYYVHTERHVREKRGGGGAGNGSDISDKSHMWNTAVGGGGGSTTSRKGASWVCGTAGLPVISPAYLLIAATAAALFLQRAALLATATCQAEAKVLYHTFAAVDTTKLIRDFLHVPTN